MEDPIPVQGGSSFGREFHMPSREDLEMKTKMLDRESTPAERSLLRGLVVNAGELGKDRYQDLQPMPKVTPKDLREAIARVIGKRTVVEETSA